jgi:hypothetical protein
MMDEEKCRELLGLWYERSDNGDLLEVVAGDLIAMVPKASTDPGLNDVTAVPWFRRPASRYSVWRLRRTVQRWRLGSS